MGKDNLEKGGMVWRSKWSLCCCGKQNRQGEVAGEGTKGSGTQSQPVGKRRMWSPTVNPSHPLLPCSSLCISLAGPTSQTAQKGKARMLQEFLSTYRMQKDQAHGTQQPKYGSHVKTRGPTKSMKQERGCAEDATFVPLSQKSSRCSLVFLSQGQGTWNVFPQASRPAFATS